MDTQKLAQEPRVPAMTTSSIVKMQPDATTGNIVREDRCGQAIQAAKLLKKRQQNVHKDDLSRFGLHD
ncbi:MAG: hypothetical protein EON60_08500 [Alphaproteobacteria bacterium]|nr:MAG: hypothetical protein EON60_08500 [Alphaproteobacteria bacterium]